MSSPGRKPGMTQVPDNPDNPARRAFEQAAKLVEALRGVCDCIMETRGPNAHEQVANARTLLAELESEDER
jgi:hypothetical protein